MAKDRKKVIHIHSSIEDRQPTPATLEVGEIAVNNAANKEFISLKNSLDKVVRFSSDEQMITWGEKKEVIPYSGTVDNVHLDANRSNIEIKLNQVVSKNTVKYDKVNGAIDIDGQPVNPSDDEGLTNGAGFAIDMSQYAMIGANPSFSSVTVTHQSNLSGTTNISNGDGGAVLNITTTDVNATNTNWKETITNKTSTVTNETDKITTLNASATTANVSGNTLDIIENTSVTVKTPTTTISGATLVADESTSISAKTPTTTLSGTSLNVTETTSTINSTNTNLTGTNLNLSEINTTINSCGKVEITTDKYTLKQCSTSGGTAEFEFCNGYTVKSNAINLQQCGTAGTINITSQMQNINGGNLTVNESGNTAINTVGTTNIKSTGNTNVETNGDNNKVTIQSSGNGGDVEVFAKDTLNETGGTVNITSTNNTNISAKDFCVNGSTSASIGAPTTNIGKACDNSTATTINISGTTINEGGTTNNNDFTTINNTATTINNKANFNITGTTYISGNTTISGDTTIGGKLYLKPDCTTITSTTVNAGLCEVLNRSAITIEKNTDPSDTRLATVYTIKQNDVVINTIEVAKDQFLKEAVVVKNTAGEWVIRLTWWIYDPDSGTHTTATTDVDASELVKDLTAVNPTDNGTAANHNVKVSSWYDSTSGDMKFSAETTPNMHVTNMYASNTVSGATVSGTTVKGATVSAGTLTATGNTTLAATTASSISATSVSSPTISGTNITASAAMRANNVSASTISATTFTGAMSKKLTWESGTFTADTTGYNGSADKVITIPTSTEHLTRGKLTVTHNGLSETYDPATDKSMTLPHSALTWQYGSVTGASNDSYNTSAGKTVTIPKNLKHLVNDLSNLTFNTGTTSIAGSPYNGSAAKTITIPAKLSHLTNDLSNLTVNFGTATGQTAAATYNGSAATSITIPTSTAHLTKSTLTIDYGDVYGKTDTSYDTTAARTITVPDSLANVSHQMVVDSTPASTSGTITIKKPISVNGTITATGAIYSSDINLKENVEYVSEENLIKAKNILFRSFNFKDDDSKRKTYGVIAQEILAAGLDELVHVKEDGMLGVDYISLLTLKLASLEYTNTLYGERIEELENKIKELESKIQ